MLELKRGRLRREAIAQALDYAACVVGMSASEVSRISSQYEERIRQEGREPAAGPSLAGDDDSDEDEGREVRIFVVGIGRDPGVDRIVSFLSERSQVPISLVSFEAYQLADGSELLLRELTDAEPGTGGPPRASALTLDDLRARAERKGLAAPFNTLVDAALDCGLYPRLFARSVMFAPPSRRTRALFTVWTSSNPQGEITTWFGSDVVAEFYPVSPDEVRRHLGDQGYRYFTRETAAGFAADLRRLFRELREEQGDPSDAGGGVA